MLRPGASPWEPLLWDTLRMLSPRKMTGRQDEGTHGFLA